MQQATALLSGLRNYLDITWEDESGDEKLIGILRRGITYLSRLTSRELLFTPESRELELLYEYCRYARAGALDEFSQNYRTDLVTFTLDERVMQFAQERE